MSDTVKKNLGGVTAYAYAKSKGYTGTEDEFAQLMANYATVGQAAEEAAEQAVNAEINAESAAQTATTKASEASSSATSAAASASAAATSESNAAASATSASGSATQAATSATAAQAAQAAAEAVLESIPEDYTELSDDVSEIRTEVSAIEGLSDIGIPLTWVQGGINTSGGNANSNYRIRTIYMPLDLYTNLRLVLQSGYAGKIYFYLDSTYKSSLAISESINIDIPQNTNRFRIAMYKGDGSSTEENLIVPTDGVNLELSYSYELKDSIEAINNEINDINNLTFVVNDMYIVQGAISPTTGNIDSANTARVTGQTYLNVEPLLFNIPEKYDYIIYYYKDGELNAPASGWLNGNHVLTKDVLPPAQSNSLRVTFRWHDSPSSGILPSDLQDYSVSKLYEPTINQFSGCSPFIYMCKDAMVTNAIPPNSKYAIKAVAENQYDKVRFSVHKTTDGYYVCVHDIIINNLAVNPDGTAISERIETDSCSLAELNQYDWGLKYGLQYAGLTVPMLSDCLHYASLYGLSVSLDFKWTTTFNQDDVNAISALLAKYGQTDAILMAVNKTNMGRFLEKSSRISFFIAHTMEEYATDADFIDGLHTGYNKIYLGMSPHDAAPTEEFIAYAMSHNCHIMQMPVDGITSLMNFGFDKGIELFECHNIENVKDTVRSHAIWLLETTA